MYYITTLGVITVVYVLTLGVVFYDYSSTLHVGVVVECRVILILCSWM